MNFIFCPSLFLIGCVIPSIWWQIAYLMVHLVTNNGNGISFRITTFLCRMGLSDKLHFAAPADQPSHLEVRISPAWQEFWRAVCSALPCLASLSVQSPKQENKRDNKMKQIWDNLPQTLRGRDETYRKMKRTNLRNKKIRNPSGFHRHFIFFVRYYHFIILKLFVIPN